MDELPDGISDEEVWEEVYVDAGFNFSWPLLIEETDPPIDPATVIAVSADVYPDVTYDLTGVRGVYRLLSIFPPIINFISVDQSYEYLYEYLASLTQYKLAPYTCTYSNDKQITYIMRVWNNYSIGRDWIASRIAYEQLSP